MEIVRAKILHIIGIAKPIPMKRELKLGMVVRTVSTISSDCKAYPDEKGIETNWSVIHVFDTYVYCKAYPDEKGIETMCGPSRSATSSSNCKAYPDEKGIETITVALEHLEKSFIAKPIPMKRELKRP